MKPKDFAREMSLRKYRGKTITSTYRPNEEKFRAQDQKKFTGVPEKAKSSSDVTKTHQNSSGKLERSKSSPDVVPSMTLRDGTIVGAAQVAKAHTPMVYDTPTSRIARKALGPVERLFEKVRLFLFRRTKNVKVNTDKYWYKKTEEFKDTYLTAVKSKRFLVKGPPQKIRFPDPVPKVVLFSLRYPSPYPYIYHRVFYKYADKDENEKKEPEKEKKEE